MRCAAARARRRRHGTAVVAAGRRGPDRLLHAAGRHAGAGHAAARARSGAHPFSSRPRLAARGARSARGGRCPVRLHAARLLCDLPAIPSGHSGRAVLRRARCRRVRCLHRGAPGALAAGYRRMAGRIRYAVARRRARVRAFARCRAAHCALLTGVADNGVASCRSAARDTRARHPRRYLGQAVAGQGTARRRRLRRGRACARPAAVVSRSGRRIGTGDATPAAAAVGAGRVRRGRSAWADRRRAAGCHLVSVPGAGDLFVHAVGGDRRRGGDCRLGAGRLSRTACRPAACLARTLERDAGRMERRAARRGRRARAPRRTSRATPDHDRPAALSRDLPRPVGEARAQARRSCRAARARHGAIGRCRKGSRPRKCYRCRSCFAQESRGAMPKPAASSSGGSPQSTRRRRNCRVANRSSRRACSTRCGVSRRCSIRSSTAKQMLGRGAGARQPNWKRSTTWRATAPLRESGHKVKIALGARPGAVVGAAPVAALCRRRRVDPAQRRPRRAGQAYRATPFAPAPLRSAGGRRYSRRKPRSHRSPSPSSTSRGFRSSCRCTASRCSPTPA